MAITIRDVTVKERLHKLVDELTETEADDVLVILTRAKGQEPGAIGRAIAEGYERVPQNAEEDAWAKINAREAIRDERW